LEDALAANAISNDTFNTILSEVEDWKTYRYSLQRWPTFSKQSSSFEAIKVTLLATTYTIPVDFTKTTVGDVKSFLGKQHGRIPQTFRLLHNRKELKVREV
jgi:hypothetical protein